jgi:hypothetical protein
MPSLSLPPSVRDARGLGVEALVERLGALDLSSLLVYSIPTAPVSVMPFLAWQFDVISPFWQLLIPGAGVPAIDGVLQKVPVAGVTSITDVGALISVDPLIESEAVIAADQSIAVQRQVLEQALALHGKRGTAWAVKTAIAALGWTNATLLEGQKSWGGTSYSAAQGWAVCRVQVPLAKGGGVPAGGVAPLIAAFNYFKPDRCLLDAVQFVMPPLADALPPMLDFGLGGFFSRDLAADLVPRMADDGFAMSYPVPQSDVWSRVPIADGSYLAAGGVTGAATGVGVVDDGVVVNGTSYGVGQ